VKALAVMHCFSASVTAFSSVKKIEFCLSMMLETNKQLDVEFHLVTASFEQL
jgi:hypothetical protein